MSYPEELDAPLSKFPNIFRKELSGEKGVGKLSSVTHIVDCECFQISGDKIYREVSIFDLKKLTFETLHCYAEDFVPFRQLSYRNKKSVKFAYGIHGLRYFSYPPSDDFFSQEALFSYLKNKFFYKKDILFGYKGGDFESYLFRKLRIPALNIEFFGVEKYEELLKRFDKKVKNCTQHYSFHDVHCSMYEVKLFAARVCEKIGDIERKNKILEKY